MSITEPGWIKLDDVDVEYMAAGELLPMTVRTVHGALYAYNPHRLRFTPVASICEYCNLGSLDYDYLEYPCIDRCK